MRRPTIATTQIVPMPALIASVPVMRRL